MSNINLEKEINVASKILDILADNNCSIAEAHSALKLVKSKMKENAKIPRKNYQLEITQDFSRLGRI